jgi:hypothetical protein
MKWNRSKAISEFGWRGGMEPTHSSKGNIYLLYAKSTRFTESWNMVERPSNDTIVQLSKEKKRIGLATLSSS